MTKDELKEKIRVLVKQVYVDKAKTTLAAAEYDELTKFPELKKVLVDLLTPDFDFFLASIDWVAPRPTTFRINLKNGTSFYLIFTPRSWIAQVEGKKYYLLNLNEEESACEAIARQLRYQIPIKDKPEEAVDSGTADITSTETTSTETETEEETPA
jgi:hypothetical protein